MPNVDTPENIDARVRDELRGIAVNAISNSSLVGFESSIEWAQWCRSLARAAIELDRDVIDRMISREQMSYSLAANPETKKESQCWS